MPAFINATQSFLQYGTLGLIYQLLPNFSLSFDHYIGFLSAILFELGDCLARNPLYLTSIYLFFASVLSSLCMALYFYLLTFFPVKVLVTNY